MKKLFILALMLATPMLFVCSASAEPLEAPPLVIEGADAEMSDSTRPESTALLAPFMAEIIGAPSWSGVTGPPDCSLFPPNCSCSCLGSCQRAFEACYTSCGGNMWCQNSCLLENSCCVDVCCGDTPQMCT